MPDDINARIAANVRAELARQSRGQGAAAKVLDLRKQSISMRLRGIVPFRAEELLRLADWLGVPVSSLIDDGSPTRVAS